MYWKLVKLKHFKPDIRKSSLKYFHNDSNLKLLDQVEVNSALLWEIKNTRDINHENTVQFVGSCIDLPRPYVLILTEYCPKTLKDVLENEAIQLDWNFRMSLIHDIVKGMA